MVATTNIMRAFTPLLAGMLLLGCQEQKPSGNTPAYSAAHGVIAGQPAHLKVGGEMFHIPADVMLQMDSSGEIINGQADSIKILLNNFTPKPTGSASIPGPSYGELWLRIEIRHAPGTRDGRGESFKHERPWASIREIPEWQLKEYQAKDQRLAWSNFNYEGIGNAPKTPTGHPVRFSCTGPYPSHAECGWGGYRLNPQVQIDYFFPAVWLPVWQQVHKHVVETVRHYHQPIQP